MGQETCRSPEAAAARPPFLWMAGTGLRGYEAAPCPTPRRILVVPWSRWALHLLRVSCSCGGCGSEKPRLPFHTQPATATGHVPITRPQISRFPDLLLWLFPSARTSWQADCVGAGSAGSAAPPSGRGDVSAPPPRHHGDDWVLGGPCSATPCSLLQ